jgi:ABC-type glycerol-3-phosphate transport system substrate-binding protein
MINATGPLGQNFALVKGKDDEYMGLPMSMDYKKGTKYMPYFRLDWLEKAGIEVKDMQHSGARISENKAYWTKEPFTFDEFVKILYTYRDGDFDGNGKADTIPFGCRGDTGLRGLWFLFTLYGMNGVQNYNDNGKTVMMATHSKLKESLKTGRKWFQEKLIDSELPNVDRASSEAKIVNGIVGAYISSYNYIALGINPIWDTETTAATMINNPEAKFLMTPMPLTVDGKALGNCTVAGLPLAMNLFCVKRETSDEKLVKILQIYPIASYFGWGEGSKMAVPQYREDILNETDYLELWGKYNGALNTIMNEFIWEAIITDIDIDAEWDAYVERWLGAGGKEVLAELEKMPLTMEIRKGNIVY